MAGNKISYPVQGAAYRAVMVPIKFTWNGTTVTASTQKACARYVASVAYTTTGVATVTFKENLGNLLVAVPSVQTSDSTAPGVLPSVGAYSSTSKTLVVNSLSAANTLANSAKAVTFMVTCTFSADVRD